MKNKLLTSLIAAAALCPALVMAQPKNVIMYIGDGFGIAPKTAARMAMGQGTTGKKFTSDAGFQVLALDKLKYVATVTTHSKNSWITDSGPGATVYSAGKAGKVDNESVAFDVQSGQPIETILENAKKQGYAVGIVTTTKVTHATPAAFASNIWFRDLEDYIASQYISSDTAQYRNIYRGTTNGYNPARDWDLPAPKVGVEVDVILGGGFKHFYANGKYDTVRLSNGTAVTDANSTVVRLKGSRADGANLIATATTRGYVYVNSRDALLNLSTAQFASGNKKVLGLFTNSHMDYEQDRQTTYTWEPSLFELTETAIKILKVKGGSKGFFLLVEGGRIDHLNHANTGGITVVAPTTGTSNLYTVEVDKEMYVGGGDGNYSATPATARQTGIYGSDYMIKEVLAFDYSVAQGRKLLSETTSKTLIFSSSDHECGGMAVVGLHDENDLQANGTKIRTYASGPRQNSSAASSGGAPSATTYATPTGIQRGDVDFATNSPEGWFPNYTTSTFQGRPELWPSVSTTGRRIVISFGSNPVTNGNGANAGGTPGNHTPQDVWVGAEDNDGNSHASQIAGQGLLDNTYLTHIMADWLGLNGFVTGGAGSSFRESDKLQGNVYPNPFSGSASIEFELPKPANVVVEIYTESGVKAASVTEGQFDAGKHTVSFSATDAKINSGLYFVIIKADGQSISKKAISL